MGFNLGREIRSAIQTYDATDQIFRNAENDRRQRERDKRDEERYGFEKQRAEREAATAQRDDELRAEFEALENARREGTGLFAEIPKNQQAMPAADAGRPTPRLGAPAATDAAAPAQPKDPVSQFLDPSRDKLYADPAAADQLYYKQLAGLMRRSYANKGDMARAAMVDSEVQKLMESGYDKVRRSATAAIVAGADGANLEPLLQRAYQTLNDGQQIKQGSVQYDPKAGKYSMVIVGADGKERAQTYDKMGLAGVLMVADPLKVLEWNTSRADKDREFALDERRTAASETTARAALTKAKADSDTSAALMKGSDIKARQDTLDALFPLAGKQWKPEDLLGKRPEEVQRLQEQAAADLRLKTGAERILGINPNVDPRTAAELARNAQKYPVLGADGGRPFTMVGGQKVYLR